MKKINYISCLRGITYTVTAALWMGAVTLLSGCGGDSGAESDLRDAEMALASGDMEVATSVATHLSSMEDSKPSLTASQLARLSIVYMQLADHSDEDTNTAMAVNYCRAAMKENADSAEAYYNQLPPDQVAYGHAVLMLVQHLDNPPEIGVIDVADTTMASPDSLMNLQ